MKSTTQALVQQTIDSFIGKPNTAETRLNILDAVKYEVKNGGEEVDDIQLFTEGGILQVVVYQHIVFRANKEAK